MLPTQVATYSTLDVHTLDSTLDADSFATQQKLDHELIGSWTDGLRIAVFELATKITSCALRCLVGLQFLI